MRAKRRDGFTLIEMLIVVAIIGVLAAVAIPSFMSYTYRARASEAVVFLGEIRQRQEAYIAEHGVYCSASAAAGSAIDSGAWNPTTIPANGEAVSWDSTADDWDQLGASPDGLVRFRYRTTAGGPGTTPGVPGYTGNEFWFVAQAEGDLDDDGETVVFEAYSAANHIFVGDDTGAPLAAGWE
jgi:prepilin-type N-terminal cleavage/methylation domain-containing protein